MKVGNKSGASKVICKVLVGGALLVIIAGTAFLTLLFGSH